MSTLPTTALIRTSTSYLLIIFFFFFNDTATTEIYTLSLHDALPISTSARCTRSRPSSGCCRWRLRARSACRRADRKSTRLNSSHGYISYAVFCLKKKKKQKENKVCPYIDTSNDTITVNIDECTN